MNTHRCASASGPLNFLSKRISLDSTDKQTLKYYRIDWSWISWFQVLAYLFLLCALRRAVWDCWLYWTIYLLRRESFLNIVGRRFKFRTYHTPCIDKLFRPNEFSCESLTSTAWCKICGKWGIRVEESLVRGGRKIKNFWISIWGGVILRDLGKIFPENSYLYVGSDGRLVQGPLKILCCKPCIGES